MRGASRRGAFTLVELIVVMSTMVVLASIAVLVVPDIMSQDRTTDGANRLRQYLQIAKSRAARDGLPRGLRLIPNAGNSNVATECQYIEAPPLYIPPNSGNPRFNLADNAPDSGFKGAPRVEFTFKPNTVSESPTQIRVFNLPDTSVIQTGGSILCPDLQAWFVIGSSSGSNPVTVTAKSGMGTMPDCGVGQSNNTYLFGIYAPAQTLIGEPVLQLPSNVGVDIASSGGLNGNTDILFNPAGDLMQNPAASAFDGQLNLWVRDVTKGGGSGGDFQKGGEQQVVAVKAKTGALGVFPLSWTGDPFQFAKKATAE